VRRIRATAWGKSIRLVALTGYGQADNRRRARGGLRSARYQASDAERLAEILAGASEPRSSPPSSPGPTLHRLSDEGELAANRRTQCGLPEAG